MFWFSPSRTNFVVRTKKKTKTWRTRQRDYLSASSAVRISNLDILDLLKSPFGSLLDAKIVPTSFRFAFNFNIKSMDNYMGCRCKVTLRSSLFHRRARNSERAQQQFDWLMRKKVRLKRNQSRTRGLSSEGKPNREVARARWHKKEKLFHVVSSTPSRRQMHCVADAKKESKSWFEEATNSKRLFPPFSSLPLLLLDSRLKYHENWVINGGGLSVFLVKSYKSFVC